MPPWDLGHYSWHDINWGDVPTFFALIGAVVAAWIAHRVYRVESRRDQQTAADRRSGQAARVGAWIQEVANEDQRGDVIDRSRSPYWRLTIRNGSDLPVYDAFVAIHATPDFADKPKVFLFGRGYGVLPPGDGVVRLEQRQVAWPPTTQFPDRPPAQSGPVGMDFHVTLRFRDSASVGWRRAPDGRLIELSGDDGADEEGDE